MLKYIKMTKNRFLKMISLIVAYDKNFGIGKENTLAWKLSEDLKNFKKITENNYIVMGRKTFESIGRPLPNRKNIILTRNKDYKQDKCLIINSTQDILNFAESKPHYEIFIIGGAQIYKEFLKYADRLYITEVDAEMTDLDAFFPQWDKSKYKRIGHKQFKKNDKNEFDFTFSVFEKNKNL
ncbi:dihydrofolate reductase [Francisella tularensis subsp. holarctica FSC022]|uniref:dihydrofolate reductase n=1 Tax=Francisella tularensis TaxID=263 RepID=UPI00015D78E0|nr:dihydrofolate reductase [Francisella tularensis]ALK94083.1 dihydrofolate reductase [Francisella tularensis]EDO65630.1 dihydrofolate reductase [Francisella tularensis subsp. holarctica FSC022]MBK2243186.1 dihydrofolate reductase [Francisella tularensis]MCC9172695.1 dihydrofolate reductase [Francisella tularensis]OCQ65987.1 dihydrofolate reductase [Francisella tularensis]